MWSLTCAASPRMHALATWWVWPPIPGRPPRSSATATIHWARLLHDWAVDAAPFEEFLSGPHGAGAMRAVIDVHTHEYEGDVLGPQDTPVSLRVSRFELFRAALGRRSPAQVSAYDWVGADPAPYLRHFFVFSPRLDPLTE